MSESTEHKSVAEQPMYIFWVLLLVLGITFIDFAVPAGLYALIYGVPKMDDWFSAPVNEYTNAALWKGRIWYEVLKVGPNSATGKATLTSFDPEKGDVTPSSFQVPFPAIGMLPQGDQLWVVSTNSVTRIEGDQSTEFKPKRLLGRTSEPFLYENQVALIDMAARPQPVLLVLKNGEWDDLGGIVIPFSFATSTVDRKRILIPVPGQSAVGPSLTDLKVIEIDNQFHLFVSDGSNIAYRRGLEMATTSALAPSNVPAYVDLSNLAEWEAVCATAPLIARGGKTGWKVGILNGEPVVITTSAVITNPFQNTSLFAYQRQPEGWKKIAEQPSPALMNLLTVSDAQTTYVAGQSFAQTLRLHLLTPTELRRTGIVLKAPVTPLQEPLERWAKIYQWIYWPSLLIMALGLSHLMSAYLNSQYTFGLTTVELASFTRRGFARLIDFFVLWAPNYALTVAFGMGSQEQAAENMDKFFDAGSSGLMLRLVWLLLSVLISALLFLLVNSILQGWWGVTLGKWICGIRTVRSTLRPCGFFRALLREILIVVDMFFGMTVLLVTFAIAFSSNRQRIGDMLADTLVIRKPKSIPLELTQQITKE